MALSSADSSKPLQDLETDVALRAILEGTATETGRQFFAALVQNLAKALATHGAWVTEYFPEQRRLRALAFWMDNQWVQDYEVDIAGSPCEQVIDKRQLVHFPDRLVELFPDDPEVADNGAVSYLGVPLLDTDESILGHLAVIDRRPIPEDPRIHAIFKIFAARAAAELQRLRAETEVRQREEKVGRLLGSAMDAIIELDDGLRILRVNPAAEKVFRCSDATMVGQDFRRFVEETDGRRLVALIHELDARPEGARSRWIAGGLTARCPEGGSFPAEATISRFELHHRMYTTLILRNIHDRMEAEQKIQSLTAETEILREELRALHQDGTLIGESQALKQVLRDIAQVAGTDTTVLIMGETGTGKELAARAIHAASHRRERPLVIVNCAAIPSTLIESEFFGHEPGAFTGATKKREGRFSLAHTGTIFLDEIGELPLDLQAKLLRVLQEGEFDPVGSSTTRKVDVRVVAATNRDLAAAVKQGTFREDLYYRLNVFPVRLPPLRDRGDDVVRLASAFAQQFCRKDGTDTCVTGDRRRTPASGLQLAWERTRATERDRTCRDHLDRWPVEFGACLARTNRTRALLGERTSEPAPGTIRTAKELEELERSNIIRALEATKWKVSGEQGAAKLLGLNASTLSSRMKALKIQKPDAC